MIFSEVYSVYYQAMSKLIESAIDGELNHKNALEIINTKAFSESFVYILDNIQSESWSLITKDYKTPIKSYPQKPITTLEKRFLKTISFDPRFKLFCDADMSILDDVEPLYSEDAIYYFDKYCDSDPYEDETYIKNFKKILRALNENNLIKVVYRNGKGVLQKGVFTPRKLEFSQKDDKFRLICLGQHSISTINLARIKSVEFVGVFDENNLKPFKRLTHSVTLEITNFRNALERSMIHFSHFEKEARKLDNIRYEMKLTYYADDETEVLIRILSFGPMLKVVAPNHFISLIKERLDNQKSCE